ncbi:hypothetical protein V8F06_006005 [Rhypophila decipiens]
MSDSLQSNITTQTVQTTPLQTPPQLKSTMKFTAALAIVYMTPRRSNSRRDGNVVDGAATRSGWYYIKEDKVEARDVKDNLVDEYATRTAWVYSSSEDGAATDYSDGFDQGELGPGHDQPLAMYYSGGGGDCT